MYGHHLPILCCILTLPVYCPWQAPRASSVIQQIHLLAIVVILTPHATPLPIHLTDKSRHAHIPPKTRVNISISIEAAQRRPEPSDAATETEDHGHNSHSEG